VLAGPTPFDPGFLEFHFSFKRSEPTFYCRVPAGGAHHQAVQLVAVRLNMRQNIFDRYRTFSRGGSYQWMSEQGSNAKDRNHL
jgi:hypothetical protein